MVLAAGVRAVKNQPLPQTVLFKSIRILRADQSVRAPLCSRGPECVVVCVPLSLIPILRSKTGSHIQTQILPTVPCQGNSLLSGLTSRGLTPPPPPLMEIIPKLYASHFVQYVRGAPACYTCWGWYLWGMLSTPQRRFQWQHSEDNATVIYGVNAICDSNPLEAKRGIIGARNHEWHADDCKKHHFISRFSWEICLNLHILVITLLLQFSSRECLAAILQGTWVPDSAESDQTLISVPPLVYQY